MSEDVPIKKARKQPEIPLEVLLQHPDNKLLDIPIDMLTMTCQTYRLTKGRQVKR